MSEAKIDAKHLDRLAGAIDHLVEHLQEEKQMMIDEKEDVFMRYMSYQRLVSFMAVFSPVMEMATTQFRLGFDLRNDAFDTKQRKKKRWTGETLEGNPFFIDENKDEDEEEHVHGPDCKIHAINGEDLPDEAKDMLAKILMRAMRSRKK